MAITILMSEISMNAGMLNASRFQELLNLLGYSLEGRANSDISLLLLLLETVAYGGFP
jgi:hypothetical protein